PEGQVEAIMRWISDTDWTNYATRKPKIGFVGLAGVSFYIGQRDTAQQWATGNPDKFEWLGAQMAPTTTTAWATEISKLKDCDYIIVGMSGPPLVSFIIESRSRGLTSKLAGPLESIMGQWALVKQSAPESALDGIVSGLYTRWWNEDVPLIKEVEQYAAKYHTADEVKTMKYATGQFNGWIMGMIFVEALKIAVANVGAENVDGAALLTAMRQVSMTVEGWPGAWKVTANANCLLRAVKLYQYKSSAGDFVSITDWYYPAGLAD
ncbi:MAG: ABC transporter substrate-binding protein, partial [Chloroflexi bacterium]|nr:ABC transporter substrate-binding protein [Chloroflexota bacterium]